MGTHVSRIAIKEFEQAWNVMGGSSAHLKVPSNIGRRFLGKRAILTSASESYLVPLMSPNITHFPEGLINADPFIYLFCWDVLPTNLDKWISIFKYLNPKVIFLTSRDSIALFNDEHSFKFEYLPEAIDVERFLGTEKLANRKIDILEYGRRWEELHNVLKLISSLDYLKHIYAANGKLVFKDSNEFVESLKDSKVTVCTTGSLSHSNEFGRYQGVELLTRRYLEAMAAGALIIGSCPKDLSDLMEANPVIEILNPKFEKQKIQSLFADINSLQELVDRNQNWVMENGSWGVRILQLLEKIKNN